MIHCLHSAVTATWRCWFWAIIVLSTGQVALAQTTSLTATATASPAIVSAPAAVTLSATISGGTAPYSYTFAGPGTLSQTGSRTATVSGLSAGVQTFTVTARDTSLPTSQTVATTVSVTVTAATISGSATICTGQSASLSVGITSGTGPFTVVYATSEGTSISVPNYTSGSPIVVSPTASTTYTLVSVTGAGGTVGPVTGRVVVVVSPLPNIAVQGSLAICSGSSSSLTALGGTNYTFAGPGGLSASNTTGLITISTVGSYSVTVTNGGGCTRILPFTIQSSTIVAPTLVVNNTLTCALTSVAIIAPLGSSNYLFTGPGFSQNGPSNVASVTAAGTYAVVVTNAAGCTASSTTTVIGNIGAPPTPTLVVSGGITCLSNSVTLTASGGATGTNYIFGGTNFVQVSPTSTAIVTSAGTYSVIVTGANGCRATAITTVVSDTALPVANVFASGQITCAQTSVTVTASIGAGSYVFSGPNNLFVISTSNTLVTSTPGTYSVVVIDGFNGCTRLGVTTVTVNRTDATVSLTASGGLTCAQTSVSLTATGTGDTFQFSGPGLAQLGTTPVVQVNRPGVYTVISSSPGGCTATSTVTVTSNTTPPVVSLAVSGPLTCTQTNVSLKAGSSGLTYRFTGPSGFDQTNQTGTATVSVAGVYAVAGTAAANGCTGTASVTVQQVNCVTALALLPPTYNCQTGAITFNTVGGDGSPVSYTVPGVQRSSLTSLTGVVEAGLRADPKTLTISATQNGVAATPISFDLSVACRSRLAVSEPESVLEVTVLGNPTTDDHATVEIRGAEGQRLNLTVHDMQGRLLTEQHVDTADAVERQAVRLGATAGLYLLNVSTATQRQAIKIVRQ